MEELFYKMLEKRVWKFIFILSIFIIGFSLVVGFLYILTTLCIKYGMFIYFIFVFIFFIVMSIILSKRRVF